MRDNLVKLRIAVLCALLVLFGRALADTIDNYMGILNAIPQMELKADPQAQAWARSARNVLTITNETIAETLLQANEKAAKQGTPLFCLPSGVNLNAAAMSDIIAQTYRDISSQQSDKDKMTISQIAYIGVTKLYSCQSRATFANNAAANIMQHVNSNE